MCVRLAVLRPSCHPEAVQSLRHAALLPGPWGVRRRHFDHVLFNDHRVRREEAPAGDQQEGREGCWNKHLHWFVRRRVTWLVCNNKVGL